MERAGAIHFLKRLAGVEPRGVQRSGKEAAANAIGLSFEDLLAQARGGEMSSGRAVEAQPGTGLDLSEEESAALAVAADRAETAGAQRALVLLEDRVLEVDVPSRSVIREVDLASGDPVTGIDAVIRADTGDGETPASALFERLSGLSGGSIDAAAGAIAGGATNRSLLELLSSNEIDETDKEAA